MCHNLRIRVPPCQLGSGRSRLRFERRQWLLWQLQLLLLWLLNQNRMEIESNTSK
jgi:hypothetical protein